MNSFLKSSKSCSNFLISSIIQIQKFVNDKKDIDSEIKAKNLYVGIMPFRSFLKQKWVVKIKPEQAVIKMEKDFFKRDNNRTLVLQLAIPMLDAWSQIGLDPTVPGSSGNWRYLVS